MCVCVFLIDLIDSLIEFQCNHQHRQLKLQKRASRKSVRADERTSETIETRKKNIRLSPLCVRCKKVEKKIKKRSVVDVTKPWAVWLLPDHVLLSNDQVAIFILRCMLLQLQIFYAFMSFATRNFIKTHFYVFRIWIFTWNRQCVCSVDVVYILYIRISHTVHM